MHAMGDGFGYQHGISVEIGNMKPPKVESKNKQKKKKKQKMQLDTKIYEFPVLNSANTGILTKSNSDLVVLRFLEKEIINSK